ncbi:MAG: hypothetical protein KatS3mg103_0594 [Phycisphaerales bacterium]|nr:MAG: hypothetical protein KatS3mg103_0594 [Phycisphaerales bacterium]
MPEQPQPHTQPQPTDHHEPPAGPPAGGQRPSWPRALVALVLILVGGLLVMRLSGGGAQGVAPTPAYLPVATDLDALSVDRPTVAIVTADWCPPCQHLKRTTLTDPAVQQRLTDGLHAVMIDATDPNQAGPALDRLGVVVLPTVVLLRQGRPVAKAEGYLPADQLLAWLEENLSQDTR